MRRTSWWGPVPEELLEFEKRHWPAFGRFFCVALAVAAVGLVGSSVTAAWLALKHPASARLLNVIGVAVFILCLGWVVYRMIYARCPNCGQRMRDREAVVGYPVAYFCRRCRLCWNTRIRYEEADVR